MPKRRAPKRPAPVAAAADSDSDAEHEPLMEHLGDMDNSQMAVINEKLLKSRGGNYLSPLAMQDLVCDNGGVPELEEFSLDLVPADGTLVNFGKRRTGKSTLTKDICYYKLQELFPRGIVISRTEDLNHFYADFIPQRFIHDELSEKLQQDLLDYQKKLKKDPKHEERLAEDPNYNRAFVIYDDVIQDQDAIRYSKPLNTIFVAGRHYTLLSIFNTQYVKAIPPTMRENVDVSFMFNATNQSTKEHLHTCFGDMLPKQLFFALLDKYTQNHCTLVFYNGDSCEKRICKKFFWYRADPDVPNFAMGTPAFWGKESGAEEEQHFEKAVEAK